MEQAEDEFLHSLMYRVLTLIMREGNVDKLFFAREDLESLDHGLAIDVDQHGAYVRMASVEEMNMELLDRSFDESDTTVIKDL